MFMTPGTKSSLLRFTVLSAAALATQVHAEDVDRYRPYLRFHSGDIEPKWGTKDHYSIGLGANFDRYVGAELAFDYYLRDWGDPSNGQVSSYHFVPEIRLRYPMFHDRLVPYVVAGIGPSWLQSKDVPNEAAGLNPQLEGFSYTVTAGAGIEYFIADNVTFGIEGKYNWVNPVEGTLGGQPNSVNLSTAFLTFGLRIYFDENHPRPFASTQKDPDSRLYFGVRLGGDFLTDGRLVGAEKLVPEQAAWGGVAGQTGGLLLGADFGEHWGAEISGDSVNHIIAVDGLGEVNEYGQGWVLANVRYRYPMGRWTPYATLGAGGVYTEVKEAKPAGEGLTFFSSKFHPAVGIGAGVEYFITSNFSVNGDVRWQYSWDHKAGIEGLVPEGSGDISYFAATIGFRVYLLDF
jgi:opacity protein-like surface antigen